MMLLPACSREGVVKGSIMLLQGRMHLKFENSRTDADLGSKIHVRCAIEHEKLL